MNKSKKSTVVITVIISFAVLGLGYVLFKTSPENQSPNTLGITDYNVQDKNNKERANNSAK